MLILGLLISPEDFAGNKILDKEIKEKKRFLRAKKHYHSQNKNYSSKYMKITHKKHSELRFLKLTFVLSQLKSNLFYI